MTRTQSKQICDCCAILRRNRTNGVPDEETRKALISAGYAAGAVQAAMEGWT